MVLRTEKCNTACIASSTLCLQPHRCCPRHKLICSIAYVYCFVICARLCACTHSQHSMPLPPPRRRPRLHEFQSDLVSPSYFTEVSPLHQDWRQLRILVSDVSSKSALRLYSLMWCHSSAPRFQIRRGGSHSPDANPYTVVFQVAPRFPCSCLSPFHMTSSTCR